MGIAGGGLRSDEVSRLQVDLMYREQLGVSGNVKVVVADCQANVYSEEHRLDYIPSLHERGVRCEGAGQ